MTSICSKYGFIAASVGLLVACGGGGGGTSSGSGAGTAVAAAGGTAANAPAVTRFSDIAVPASFSWGTVQFANAVVVTVSSGSKAILGSGRVVISNYIDKDPTGSGEPIPPMSTDVIATALASNATGPSATVSFDALRFPAGTSHVLVEVFDMADGARLASSKVTVSSLLASSLRIDL